MIIDSKLNFNKHIEAITHKAYAALGFVKRFCFDIGDRRTLKALYYTLVQSHLDYCSIVWHPFYQVHKDKIESVLKQFTMFALGEYQNETNGYRISSYEERLKNLDMISLQRSRVLSALTFLFDALKGNVQCPGIFSELEFVESNYNTRTREFIKL